MSNLEQTRDFVIEKTAPIFNSKGYAGTSLTDMTTAICLTKGSIYSNFNNKDEVVLAAFDYKLAKVNSILQSELQKHSTAREKLRAYVKVYQNFSSYPFPADGCPVLNIATDLDYTHRL